MTLALVFVSCAAYVVSFIGVVLIQNRVGPKWFIPALFGLLVWMLTRHNRMAMKTIPNYWAVAMWIAWVNACVWIVATLRLPATQMLRFDRSAMLLASRASAADVFAIAFSLVLLLWYQPDRKVR